MIKIHNKTDLSYKTIGQVIDKYIHDGVEETLYPGKVDSFDFIYKSRRYHVEITYTERDVDWRFIDIGHTI